MGRHIQHSCSHAIYSWRYKRAIAIVSGWFCGRSRSGAHSGTKTEHIVSLLSRVHLSLGSPDSEGHQTIIAFQITESRNTGP